MTQVYVHAVMPPKSNIKEGDIWFDDSTSQMHVWSGNWWQEVVSIPKDNSYVAVGNQFICEDDVKTLNDLVGSISEHSVDIKESMEDLLLLARLLREGRIKQQELVNDFRTEKAQEVLENGSAGKFSRT